MNPQNRGRYRFDPSRHLEEIEPLVEELRCRSSLDRAAYEKIVRRHPREEGGFFSKSQVIRAERFLARRDGR
ncbi:MAG: hypothetical protein R3234_09340, partial [Thermoanaerobaculia bacterium]|nr:hypothetical protein [Thermoanaerobaculia bacterium]